MIKPTCYPLADGSRSTDYIIGDTFKHVNRYGDNSDKGKISYHEGQLLMPGYIKCSSTKKEFLGLSREWINLAPTKKTLRKVAQRKEKISNK